MCLNGDWFDGQVVGVREFDPVRSGLGRKRGLEFFVLRPQLFCQGFCEVGLQARNGNVCPSWVAYVRYSGEAPPSRVPGPVRP